MVAALTRPSRLDPPVHVIWTSRHRRHPTETLGRALHQEARAVKRIACIPRIRSRHRIPRGTDRAHRRQGAKGSQDVVGPLGDLRHRASNSRDLDSAVLQARPHQGHTLMVASGDTRLVWARARHREEEEEEEEEWTTSAWRMSKGRSRECSAACGLAVWEAVVTQTLEWAPQAAALWTMVLLFGIRRAWPRRIDSPSFTG